MTIQITQGDLLKQDDVDAIVNTVNCVGVMGKGIALQFKNKWPSNFTAYQAACKAGEVQLGKVFLYDTGGLLKPNYIINFPTKNHWKEKSHIESVRSGLVDLVEQIKRLNIHSIAIPPLGCGNGGLAWQVVRPIIEEAFIQLPNVTVKLFEPTGAPSAKSMEVKSKRPVMTHGRAAILKLLDTYRELNYGLSKIEVQKLAYFLQTAGENLKLNFVKHTYGPYSQELRHALNNMEGHFIRGLGDGTVEAEIEPIDAALREADAFIEAQKNEELIGRVKKVNQLIDGFQSPYGMELLATVHWVSTQDGVKTLDEATEAIHQWSLRKKELMSAEHISVAWKRLRESDWLHV